MIIKRNWFFCLAMYIYVAMIGLALCSVIGTLGAGQEYPYLLKGELIIALIAAALLMTLFLLLYSKLNVSRRLESQPKVRAVIEWTLVSLILLASLTIRVVYIKNMPMVPESDYKTYYEVAQLLMEGRLIADGPGYCDYIAIFPHVIGYPVFLTFLFRVFGVSYLVAEYANAVLAVLTVFLVWRITRILAGRFAAFTALVITAFWPSTILYDNFAASEYLFTFLLAVCILIFVKTMQDTPYKEKHPSAVMLELMLLGFIAAVTNCVRPMAQIFLFAMSLSILHGLQKLPVKLRNDIPLGKRAVNKGWKRILIAAFVFLLFNKLFTASVSYTIDRELAGGSASFGYNLLVGLNTDSYGGWNQDDADYLYAALDETGSASAAQAACRDLAFERLKTDPRALLNLFVHKFEVLWGNDDFGASWNILFMDQQGNLTPEREAFLYRAMDFCDLAYAVMLILCLLAGVGTIRSHKVGPEYALYLTILGTMALHLFVENQNRYHYHAIILFAILIGITVGRYKDQFYDYYMEKTAMKERADREKEAEASRVEELKREKKEYEDLRAQALHAQFDMGEALAKGHISIVASEAAVQEVPEECMKENDETQ